MNLTELLQKLSYGPLSELAIAGEGFGTVPVENIPRLVIPINDALTKLYARFALAKETVILETVDNVYAYRLADNGIHWAGPIHTGGSVRGTGRTLTLLLYAAMLSDHPEMFTRWVNAQIDELSAALSQQTGIQIDQKGARSQGYPNHEMAPWQHGMETEALGHAVSLNFTNAQVPFDYLGNYFIDCMLEPMDNPTKDVLHEDLTSYGHAWQNADGTPVADRKAGVNRKAIYTPKIAAALLTAESSAERQVALGYKAGDSHHKPGDFVAGNPASESSYAAQDQGAMARIRDHHSDKVRAKAAYDKFMLYARVPPGTKWAVVAQSTGDE